VPTNWFHATVVYFLSVSQAPVLFRDLEAGIG